MASDSSQSRCVRSSFMALPHQLAVWREMDAAFTRRLFLPPPAAVARVLTLDHGPRARRAADRAVALVVQRVVGHLVPADVVPDLVLQPARERIELLQSVHGVPFLKRDLGAQRG